MICFNFRILIWQYLKGRPLYLYVCEYVCGSINYWIFFLDVLTFINFFHACRCIKWFQIMVKIAWRCHLITINFKIFFHIEVFTTIWFRDRFTIVALYGWSYWKGHNEFREINLMGGVYLKKMKYLLCLLPAIMKDKIRMLRSNTWMPCIFPNMCVYVIEEKRREAL